MDTGNTETDLDHLLLREDIFSVFKVNLYDGVLWFNKESAATLQKLIWMLGYYQDVFDVQDQLRNRWNPFN
jgi:hypothetical protein